MNKITVYCVSHIMSPAKSEDENSRRHWTRAKGWANRLQYDYTYYAYVV